MAWPALALFGGVIGFLYGFVMQKADFCFVCGFRDYFAFRHTRVLGGIIIAVLLTMVGWALLIHLGVAPASRFWVPPVGLNSLIGGVVFGVGMVVAGSCATSTLWRAGAGYLYFWVVLAASIAGYGLFSAVYDPWLARYFFTPLQWAGPLTLYDLVPGIPRPLVALAIAGTVVLAAGARLGWRALWQGVVDTLRPLRQPLVLLRARSWDIRLAAVAMAAIAIVQFSVLSIFGVTGPGARWAGIIGRFLFGEPAIRANPYMAGLFKNYPAIVPGPEEILFLFIIVGGFAAAWLGNNFRWRRVRWERLPNAIIGGFLLGFGSRLTPGCNVGNVFTGLAELSVHSIVATLGILIGVYAATRVVYRNASVPARSIRLANGD